MKAGLNIIRETLTHVISVWHDADSAYEDRESKDKKFLCIGGPFAGQKKAGVQLIPDTYVRFNRASRVRRDFLTPRRRQITQVFIHIATYL